MDPINPTPGGRALTVSFGTRLYRYRSLLRRRWWILALSVGITVAFQAWRVFDMTASNESSSEQRVSGEPASIGMPTGVRKESTAFSIGTGMTKHLIAGLLGGLLFGGAILFFIDRADDRMASSLELIEHFSEPILAQIPNVSESRTETGLPLMRSEDERFSYAEAFRSLRSSLLFMPHQTEFKAVAITSAISNEGKSTIASNLGITMAASGARVLLVDAALRRGGLAALFGTDDRPGLTNILREELIWESTVQKTAYETLWLIPRGPVTDQSDDLLLRPILQTLLEKLKADYDLVIFNTAPVLSADDTPTLARHFDGTLMVVRAHFTSARLVKNALKALYQRKVTVLGLILNRVDIEAPEYYYYRDRKHYGVA
jgi:capsular exopolysaccharide synthesis family protein